MIQKTRDDPYMTLQSDTKKLRREETELGDTSSGVDWLLLFFNMNCLM